MYRLLVLLPLALLTPAAPAAAQLEQSEKTELDVQIDGGSKTKNGKRTVFGRVHYGSVPGMYIIKERRNDEGDWIGSFTIMVDRFEVMGSTTFELDKAGYVRTWAVEGGTRACSTVSSGLLTSTGSFEKNGTFMERLQGAWNCTAPFVGHGPPLPKSHDFKSKWTLVPTSRGALIGRERGNLMYTRRGLVYLYEEKAKGSHRCHFENWDGAGSLNGSFPCKTRKRRFKPREGSAQLTGRGDPEYRRVHATGPFELTGRLNKRNRGELKLRGDAWW